MLQNTYSLPDLIDLALRVPEIGAVNFNILHTVLQSIVTVLKIRDVRPWCQIENPQLSQLAFTKEKLKSQHARSLSQGTLPVTLEPVTSVQRAASTEAKIEGKTEEQRISQPSSRVTEDAKPAKSLEQTKSSVALGPDSPEQGQPSENKETAATKDSTGKEERADIKDSNKKTEVSEPKKEAPKESPTVDKTQTSEIYKEESKKASDGKEVIGAEVLPPQASTTRIQRERFKSNFTLEKLEQELEKKDEALTKEVKVPTTKAGEAWKFTNLSSRTEALEEGMYRISNIVDLIADKIKKAEARKQEGGPSSEELEAMDDRLLELEEAREKFEADHEKLMEMEKTLAEMLHDFEEIKQLAAQINQMQIDISTKADKEETWEQLALKGDLELVNTKVDQLEFETAIEELGEAIGLLGIKFVTKNDEWEERASEIWDAIHGKMSRDIFEEAKLKTEARLMALMEGLRKMKKIVEELLYPNACGISKCMSCRRPADVSGKECIRAGENMKKSLQPSNNVSYKNEEKENFVTLKKGLNEIIIKKLPKSDGPPYSGSRSTIISIPYCSTTYPSSTYSDDEQSRKSDVKIPLLSSNKIQKNEITKEKKTQIPKLPRIQDSTDIDPSAKPLEKKRSAKSKKNTAGIQHGELIFTNKLLKELERKEPKKRPEESHYIVAFESRAKPLSSEDSTKSLSLNVMDAPLKTIDIFAPVRLMDDPLRQTILESPSNTERSSRTISSAYSKASKNSSSKRSTDGTLEDGK